MATPCSGAKSGGLRRTFRLLVNAAMLSLLGACANSGTGKDLLTRSIGTRTFNSKSADVFLGLPKEVVYWEKEVRKNPNNPKAALNLGKSLKAAGAKRRAYAFLRTAVTRHPNDVPISSEFGRLAVELGQLGEAETILARIDNTSNRDWQVISARGTIRAKQGKHVEARAFYERALRIAPAEPSVLNNIALTFALDGKPERAESLLRRAADNGDTSERITENLALILGLQGRFDEARQISNKSLPEGIADSNLEFLQRMIRAADASETSSTSSKPARKQHVAMADPSANDLVSQKHELAEKSILPQRAKPSEKSPKTKLKAVPIARKTKKVHKTIFGEFKYPPQKSGSKNAPKKVIDESAPMSQQVKLAEPATSQKAAKTPKPLSLPQWSTKVTIKNKSLATAKIAKHKSTKSRGTVPSKPDQVSQSPLSLIPVPGHKNVQASFDWTSKVTINKDGTAIKAP